MTREAKLAQYISEFVVNDPISDSNVKRLVLIAMGEWAKGFADWIRVEGWNNRNGYDWCRYETIYSDISVKTTEELYQIFESQNK